MDVLRFVSDSGLIVMAAVYALCAVVKQIPKAPNWIIPIVALVCGVVIGGFTIGTDAQSLIMGGLAGWAAVGVNQTVKQTSELKKSE